MKGRVLIIAGSDPSGGAGLQADIKTVTALGGYAATVVTAITVQNTTGVFAVHPTPPDVILAQARAVIEDIGADAVKIGMIGEIEAARAIAGFLRDRGATRPIVLDPVLAAAAGGALAASGMVAELLEQLVPLAALVTPNADEAAALTGGSVTSAAEQEAAARALVARGARAALVKGGHVPGDTVIDMLVAGAHVTRFENPRIATRAGHGTGCTLASAIATGLAFGQPLDQAAARGISFVREALRAAPGFGAGVGPLGHAQVGKRC